MQQFGWIYTARTGTSQRKGVLLGEITREDAFRAFLVLSGTLKGWDKGDGGFLRHRLVGG